MYKRQVIKRKKRDLNKKCKNIYYIYVPNGGSGYCSTAYYSLSTVVCEGDEMSPASSAGVVAVIVIVVLLIVLAVGAAVVCYVARRQGRR